MEETPKPRSCADYGIRLTPRDDGGVTIEAPSPTHLDPAGIEALADALGEAAVAARKMFIAAYEASKR
jgi:hypothetical protein